MRHPVPTLRLAAFVIIAALVLPGYGQFPVEKPRGPMDGVIVDSPELRADLGEISDQLQLCLTLDSRESVLAFWRTDLVGRPEDLFRAGVKFIGPVVFGAHEKRIGANFSTPGTLLDLHWRSDPLRDYTLAAWVHFPTVGAASVIWGTVAGIPLAVSEGRFVCVPAAGNRPVESRGVAVSGQPAPRPAPSVIELAKVGNLSGWHHLAVACDAGNVVLFLDGVQAGRVAASIPLSGVMEVGGSRAAVLPGPAGGPKAGSCGAMDDMFIFSGALTGRDLKKVSAAQARVGTVLAQAGQGPGRAGAPLPGPPTSLPPATRPVASVEPTTQQAASEIMRKHTGSLVFVSGTVGAGSGFIGQLRGTTFLFTNAHVAAGVKGAGFKTLEGTQVQLGTPAIATGHDIFLATLAPGKPAIEIMIGVDQNAAVGDGVVVLGNAEGGGVINTIIGKIVGIGPDRVEVDAPFQPGNSGSPIIHLKSGKVIGVATYLTIKKYDSATKEVLATPVVRRFGYRLDSVKKWEPVAWPAFYAQAGEMEKVEQLTADLEKFLIDIAKDSRVSLGVHNNPAIKPRIDQWQASKKGRSLSAKDLAQINLNFLAFIKSACRSDTTAAQTRMTYDYFQRQLTGEQQIRGERAEIFDKIIKDLEKER